MENEHSVFPKGLKKKTLSILEMEDLNNSKKKIKGKKKKVISVTLNQLTIHEPAVIVELFEHTYISQ